MQSYTRGPQAAILHRTIGETFLDTARQFPEGIAMVVRQQNVRLTWRESAQSALRVAAGLRSLGLQPGDRAGVWATNCLEWVLLQFGCALAGVVLVNINPAYRSRELSFVLSKSRMKVLFLHDEDRRTNYRAILEETRANQQLALEHVISLGSPAWRDFLREPDVLGCTWQPGDTANIQYTSGTTGVPKGVL
jgi:fatty-acyl-CoA synthase